MDTNSFFYDLEVDDVYLGMDETYSTVSSDTLPGQQPWQWPGQSPSSGSSVQGPYYVPQSAVEARMDVQVPQLAEMSYNPSPLLMNDGFLESPFLQGNELSSGDSAEQQNNELFLQGSGQLIDPNPSQYTSWADSFNPCVKSHEDYGLRREMCRKLGDYQTRKPLPVFCLLCQEPLPEFGIRCEYCTEFHNSQPPDTLESRSCIICKADACSWESIFCEYHSKKRAIFSPGEKRALIQAGICNVCWRQDTSPGYRTCNECRELRRERYHRRKRMKEEGILEPVEDGRE
ncbi:hypothetical protein FPOAC2_02480 [Fusarium poae]